MLAQISAQGWIALGFFAIACASFGYAVRVVWSDDQPRVRGRHDSLPLMRDPHTVGEKYDGWP